MDRSKSLIAVGCLAFCWMLSACAQAGITLVEDGRPRAQIVLPDQPEKLEQLAAEELRQFVEKMSGAKLEVRTADKVEPARVRILLGGAAKGVISAKKLDQALGSRRDDLNCRNGFVIVTGPDYIAICGVEPSGTLFGTYELLERLGCRWFWPGEIGQVVPTESTIKVGPIDIVSVPSFDQRAEWFSGDGELDPEAGIWNRRNRLFYGTAPAAHHSAHPGFRTPEAAQMKADEIRAALKKRPDEKWFSLSWGDTSMNVSAEEGYGIRHPWRRNQFQAVDFSLDYYNKVAKLLEKEHPDLHFGFYVYNDYFYVPIDHTMHRSLVPVVAALGPCARHIAGTGTCWHRDMVFQLMRRWCQMSDKVFIYDFEPGFVNNSHGVPMPAVTRFRKEMPMMAKMGIRGIMQQSIMSLTQQAPNYYIRAKLMWDAHADVDALLNDYYSKLFGPAAKPVRAYWDALEEMMHSGPAHAGSVNIKVIYPIEKIRPLEQYIRQAEAKADTEMLRRRVRVMRYSYDNLMMYLGMRQAEDQGRFAEAAALAKQQLEFHKKIDGENKFFYKVGDMDRYHEDYLPLVEADVSTDQALRARRLAEWKWDYAHLIGGRVHDNQGRAELVDGSKGELVAMLPEQWAFRTDPFDQGIIYAWFDPKYDAGDWKPILTTRFWESQGYSDQVGHGYDGTAWYRTEVNIPAKFAGKTIKLNFGGVRKRDPQNEMWIWVNGQFAGKGITQEIMVVGIGMVRWEKDTDISKLVKAGAKNVIAVRVENPYGNGGLYRRVLAWSPAATFGPKQPSGKP